MRTLPWNWYTDPETLRLEQERIFRRAWQYVGHTGQLGTYFTATAGDVPVVVTRARDAELRAFANVCRHRGHPVAEGQGDRRTLQCAYHAWTYDLDGVLRSAPRAQELEDSGLTLVPLQVETWGPFVFVNPDRGAPPLADALGEMPRQLEQVLDLKALRFHHRSQFEVEANWKVACENFLECYHCPVAHPSFSAVVDVSPDEYRLESYGLVASQFAHTRDDGTRGQFHLLWPNLTVNVFPGEPNLSLGPVIPVAPARTARFLDYFFAEDADEEWISDLLELDGQVCSEDTKLVEGVQRGLRAGVIEHGQLLERSEQLVAHFQQLTAIALAE